MSVTDERLAELREQAYHGYVDDWTGDTHDEIAAIIDELRTLRASPVARTEGEGILHRDVVLQALRLAAQETSSANFAKRCNEAYADILTLPPRVEPAATGPDDYCCPGCGRGYGLSASPPSVERLTERDLGSKPNARYDNGWYYCWLIERRDMPQPMYWTEGCTWSQYAGEALWYARWSDANAAAGECPHDVVVCEHGFDLGGAR